MVKRQFFAIIAIWGMAGCNRDAPDPSECWGRQAGGKPSRGKLTFCVSGVDARQTIFFPVEMASQRRAKRPGVWCLVQRTSSASRLIPVHARMAAIPRLTRCHACQRKAAPGHASSAKRQNNFLACRCSFPWRAAISGSTTALRQHYSTTLADHPSLVDAQAACRSAAPPRT